MNRNSPAKISGGEHQQQKQNQPSLPATPQQQQQERRRRRPKKLKHAARYGAASQMVYVPRKQQRSDNEVRVTQEDKNIPAHANDEAQDSVCKTQAQPERQSEPLDEDMGEEERALAQVVDIEPISKKIYQPDFLRKFEKICTERPPGMLDIRSLEEGSLSLTSAPPSFSPRAEKVAAPPGFGKKYRKGHKKDKNLGTSVVWRREEEENDTKQECAEHAEDGTWAATRHKPLGTTERVIKTVKGLLNRLTEQNFEVMSTQIVEAGTSNPDQLGAIVQALFAKAVIEPAFSPLYARLCSNLSTALPSPSSPEQSLGISAFTEILLNRCQEEFEKPPESVPKKQRQGLVVFIGELYKYGMLPVDIIFICIDSMLQAPGEDEIDVLCSLLWVVGSALEADSDAAGPRLEGYFTTLRTLSTKQDLSPRSKFGLRDLLDAREKAWRSHTQI